jgi:hypothetical protein
MISNFTFNDSKDVLPDAQNNPVTIYNAGARWYLKFLTASIQIVHSLFLT